MKKKILMVLSLVIVATLSVKTTVAYLQSETEQVVNTMEAGKVDIEQLEYERVVDENGKWILTSTEDQYGYTPDKLQEFTQNKPIVPAVYADGTTKWDDRNGNQEAHGEGSHQQSWAEIGAPGSNQLFDDSVRNVIDKFVFVKNTGNTNAYVRTWIAFEQGELSAEKIDKLLHLNVNRGWWKEEQVATDVVITDENGVESKYVIVCYTFLGENSSKTGILTPNSITRPSLLQLFIDPTATNEDVELLDGNDNGKFDVLVVSQAMQADGYDLYETGLENATNALNIAFGEVKVENHPFYR